MIQILLFVCAQPVYVAKPADWQADHSDVIQAAVDKHWSQGATSIVLPPGYMTITKPILLYRKDTTPHPADYARGLQVRGQRSTVVWCKGFTEPAFDLQGAWFSGLKDFRIIGDNKTGVAVHVNMGRIVPTSPHSPSRGVYLRRMQIERFDVGLKVGDAWGPDVTNWHVSNSVFTNNRTHHHLIGANVDGFVTTTTLAMGDFGAVLEATAGDAPNPPPGTTRRGGAPRATYRDMTTSVRGVTFKAISSATLNVQGCRAEGQGTFAEVSNQSAMNSRFYHHFIRCNSTMGKSLDFQPYGAMKSKAFIHQCHFDASPVGSYESP